MQTFNLGEEVSILRGHASKNLKFGLGEGPLWSSGNSIIGRSYVMSAAKWLHSFCSISL